MQSDTPQGDPRLQRINPNPAVATKWLDPCIVFLETTLPGEIPMLAACWARRGHEYCRVGEDSCLALGRVLVVQNQARPYVLRHNLWEFKQRGEKVIFLIAGGKDGSLVKCDFKATPFKLAPGPIFRWHVRYLSEEQDLGLERAMWKFGNDSNEAAGLLFRRANVDWPSITDAMSAIRRHEKKQRRNRSSLVRRLISSVFKKKPQPVHV